jgi:hypothetical protein
VGHATVSSYALSMQNELVNNTATVDNPSGVESEVRKEKSSKGSSAFCPRASHSNSHSVGSGYKPQVPSPQRP